MKTPPAIGTATRPATEPATGPKADVDAEQLAAARRAASGRWYLPSAALALVTLCMGALRWRGQLLDLHGAVESWAAITIAITLQALPFLLLGVLVSALISALVPQSLLKRLTPANGALAVPTAATCGLLLPGCECASVPVAQSLIRRGLPPAAAYAFLLASPAVNPVVLVATAVAYTGNPTMVWARLAASLLSAMVVGWVWLALGHEAPAGQAEAHEHGGVSRAEAFRASAVHDFMNASGYLAAGAMVAALIKVVVPRSWFTVLQQYPAVAILVMAALAVLLSLCSEADAFVAAAFNGVSLTAQLVFLVVGPMVDLKLIAMQYGAWGRGFVLRFVPLTLAVAVLCGTVVGALLLGGM
ncbi:Predicted permease [Actinomyces bovis]|uniref:Predicted permease n=1 Tax=Actinomyces bovis TaxID=1658 RepID=A0ABY1VPM0_9ACTO|nr:permease [Actinomyces bovis]SPT53397.1 Predicted permease [Actinomyces bovis]VEG52811.1 Predicted permease [Actinomyces israelii]